MNKKCSAIVPLPAPAVFTLLFLCSCSGKHAADDADAVEEAEAIDTAADETADLSEEEVADVIEDEAGDPREDEAVDISEDEVADIHTEEAADVSEVEDGAYEDVAEVEDALDEEIVLECVRDDECSDGNPCNGEEYCDPATHVCMSGPLPPGGTVCRPAADRCDAVEVCDGVTLECPADERLPEGAPCDDGNPLTTDDMCDSSGVCSGTPVCALGDIVDIDSGAYHACALLAGGNVKCWGTNDYGEASGILLVYPHYVVCE